MGLGAGGQSQPALTARPAAARVRAHPAAVYATPAPRHRVHQDSWVPGHAGPARFTVWFGTRDTREVRHQCPGVRFQALVRVMAGGWAAVTLQSTRELPRCWARGKALREL